MAFFGPGRAGLFWPRAAQNLAWVRSGHSKSMARGPNFGSGFGPTQPYLLPTVSNTVGRYIIILNALYLNILVMDQAPKSVPRPKISKENTTIPWKIHLVWGHTEHITGLRGPQRPPANLKCLILSFSEKIRWAFHKCQFQLFLHGDSFWAINNCLTVVCHGFFPFFSLNLK